MISNPFDLTGRVALVTGGGTGLGLGIAKALAGAGARVVLTGRREAVLQEAAWTVGAGAAYLAADVADLPTIPSLVREVEQAHGPIDILVNNAGINLKKFALDVTDDEFAAILQTNVQGLFALSREVGRGMVGRQHGSIINITSMAAIYGISLVAAYSAAKTAVLGLTRALATDLSPHGVRVNAIAPGFIDSPMLQRAMASDPQCRDKVLGRTPLGRFGHPDDIGHAAVYLASDAAKFVTGINLPVDGGNSIGF
jgi:NAD(P)-dependent dehydrogenase (short-subunit alcohol dehydrogenase family)